MTTIATICARKGSKGLPGKNTLPFAGRPLIVHTIMHALECRDIDGVYVSTDCPKIAEIAASAGATVPYLRPPELATDEACKLPAIEHLVSHLESQGLRIDRIVDLQPTSPLRDSADIAQALRTRPNAELVVSVCEARDNPYFNLVEQTAGGLVCLSKGCGAVCRQDAPVVYVLNGSIYVWQRPALREAIQEGMWSRRIAPYFMPDWKSADIDTQDDCDYAQWLWLRHQPGGSDAWLSAMPRLDL